MTDAIVTATAAKAAVSGALKKASASTGVDFNYLYRVAMRESAMDPAAKAKTSSAAGLFQFIEETWLTSMKKYGAAHGLAHVAADISTGADGRPRVADAARRKEILDMRFDPEIAAALAGELARENRKALEASLGRAVDGAELYAAHFLGATGATKLLTAKAEESAARLLPAAAKANQRVFYDGARARTVAEVIEGFRKTIGAAQVALRTVGAHFEKSFRPLLREGAEALLREPLERASFTPKRATPAFDVKSLSPLALAVLQALDPRELRELRDR